jgi:hypothetical protein
VENNGVPARLDYMHQVALGASGLAGRRIRLGLAGLRSALGLATAPGGVGRFGI